MKLTNYIRDAFVVAALQDVPQENYEEAMTKEINRHHMELLKQHHLDKADPQRMRMRFLHFKGRMRSFALAGMDTEDFKKIESDPKIQELLAKHQAQHDKISGLQEKLSSIAYGCTTSKQLIELLPEFEKYLPSERAKTQELPAISNMVGDFLRAGWPKDKKQAA